MARCLHASPQIIYCTHRDFLSYSTDFSELWRGAPEKIKGHGADRWKGGFRGRPKLATAIWQPLNDWLFGKGPEAFRRVIYALREFWRFLDGYEANQFSPVNDLSDATAELGILWITPVSTKWNPVKRKSAYVFIGTILRLARKNQFGSDDLFEWPSYPKAEPTADKDLPSDAEIRCALTLLKHTAYQIYNRWQRADRLAAEGRDLSKIKRHAKGERAFEFIPNEADAHATYRSIIEKSGKAILNVQTVNRALGLDPHGSLPCWWPRYSQDHGKAGRRVTLENLNAGLYPTVDDIDCLSQLFMARTGWNPATVLDVDVSNPNWSRQYGEQSANLWIIESFKDRNKSWQWTLSHGRLTTGPYHILTTLIQRTAALRELIKDSPNLCDNPTIALRSPWLSAGAGNCSGRVNVRHSGSLGTCSTYWKLLVQDHNASNAQHRLIPPSMTPSDWRDIFASHVFQDSRYSWILVQWALGHRSITSTRTYLRKALWRRHSEKALSTLQTLLIDGIEAHARVDATIIRAKMEFGYTCSEDDIDRLERHRRSVNERDVTYSGYLCADQTHPPEEIDPGNPCNGTLPCRRGDRCAGCPMGQAIDSKHLVKRMVELRWIRERTSSTTWLESHYASDLCVLETDLTQWSSVEVSKWESYWQNEIISGRHKVIRFGGLQ
jgi:hypothetical protein